ncbi:MAG: hypothetical protein WCA36_01120 [Pseudolabrys sp.]
MDLALVPLRRLLRGEGAEVAPLAGLGILLARIDAVSAAGQLADHGCITAPPASLAEQEGERVVVVVLLRLLPRARQRRQAAGDVAAKHHLGARHHLLLD